MSGNAEQLNAPHVLVVCSILCWQSAECCSEFSKLDDDTDIWHVDDSHIGSDDRQRDITESSTDNESDIDVE